MQKSDDYYKSGRPEMLKYIPENLNTILDIGCGEGNFGNVLKSMTKAEVWGVEIQIDIANIASKKLDKVINSDVFQAIEQLPEKYFDCIIFNDSLEHLTEPSKLLTLIHSKLSENACVIASIPNVRYISNLKELLIDRDWRYRNYGILDDTHFRFFTKRSIIRMFVENGYEIIKIEGINPYGRNILFYLFNIFSFGMFSDSRYLQFAVIAKSNQNND